MFENPGTFITISFILFFGYFIRRAYQPMVHYLDEQKRLVASRIEDAHNQLEQAHIALDHAKKSAEAMMENIESIEIQAKKQIETIEQIFKKRTAALLKIKKSRTAEYLEKIQHQFNDDLYDQISASILQRINQEARAHQASTEWTSIKQKALNMMEESNIKELIGFSNHTKS